MHETITITLPIWVVHIVAFMWVISTILSAVQIALLRKPRS
jgi:hypothetical protein